MTSRIAEVLVWRVRLLALVPLMLLAGCPDARSPVAPEDEEPQADCTANAPNCEIIDAGNPAIPGLIVSESRAIPHAGSATTAAGDSGVAYVSVAPGALSTGRSARLRNLSVGGPATSPFPISDGGFDPVVVSAGPGDRLELAVLQFDGTITVVTFVVPVRRPPVVVRTNPPKGRTDVALSIRPAIIFSEPIDPQTLGAAVQLLGDDASPVSGTPRLVDGLPFIVEFVPDAPLVAASGYELVITTALRDAQGETLESETRVAFSTRPAPGPGVDIQAASGSDQPGKAGQELGEPFVVRVTDQGAGVPDVEVMWTVTSGEGVLDGHWNACPSSPVVTTTGSTDADGYARVSFMPTWFGSSTVTAAVPELPGAAVQFSTDASDPGARLEVAYGGQFEEAVAGIINRNGGFSVHVRDGQGNVVPYLPVTWTLTSGAAQLFNVNDTCEPRFHWQTLTSRIGLFGSRLEYRPIVYGISTFTASVPGVQGSPLTFTADATVLEVILSDDRWVGLPVVFGGPDYSSDITVPVGARVEFWNRMPSARIVSTSVPPGGTPFDSGMLTTDGRLQVVPNVAGVWTFTDQVSGAVGTMTVQPGIP